MAASLRKQDDTLERRVRVSELYRSGLSQNEIAREVGKSPASISNDLKIIRKIWLERIASEFDELQSEELAKLDRLERISNDAWEKSENTSSDAKFLDIVKDVIKQRVDILGLNDPAKFGQRAIASGKDQVRGVVEVIVESREQVKAVLSFEDFAAIANGNGKAG